MKTIPLHIADQAVAACEAEIQKLREENARLREAGDELAKCITPDDFNWARKYVILWREACKGGGQP
jgi:hypothetical protein